MSDIRKALEALESVLCDPDGHVCIRCSRSESDVLDDALDQLRALAQPQAAQSDAAAYRSSLITAFCAKWSSNDRPEAGDVLEWLMAQPLATPPTEPQAAQPRLTVHLQSFPESNGKRNWTAMFVRAGGFAGLVGNCGGITIARGELWNRVAYSAECAKLLIGERDTEPDILDYGDDIKTPDLWLGEVRGGYPVR